MCAHNPHPTGLTIYGANIANLSQKPENQKIAKLCSQIARTISLFTTAYIVRQRIQQVKKSATPCKHCIKYSFYIIKKNEYKTQPNPTQHNTTFTQAIRAPFSRYAPQAEQTFEIFPR